MVLLVYNVNIFYEIIRFISVYVLVTILCLCFRLRAGVTALDQAIVAQTAELAILTRTHSELLELISSLQGQSIGISVSETDQQAKGMLPCVLLDCLIFSQPLYYEGVILRLV